MGRRAGAGAAAAAVGCTAVQSRYLFLTFARSWPRTCGGRHAIGINYNELGTVTQWAQTVCRTCCLLVLLPGTCCAVWYEIYTLSRPGSWLTQATRPLLRAFQRKFAADSMAAMQREMLRP